MCAGACRPDPRRAIPCVIEITPSGAAPMTSQIPSFRNAFLGFTASTAVMIATMVLIAGLNA
jgi:hypothetical protein